MFKEIEPLLEKAEAVNILLCKEGDKIRVNFTSSGNDSLPPLSLVATAAELDAGFVDAIKQYEESDKNLADQIAAFAADAEKVRAEQAVERERKAQTGKGKTKHVPAACCPGDNDDGDDAPTTTVAPATPKKVQAPSTDITDLFS